MSKFSDIAGGRGFPYNVRELLSISNWVREFKWAKQRKQRGWSDRDTWSAGEYLVRVMSGMLKKLGDEKSHVDWDQYFVTNYPNNLGYKSLQEVAEDLDHYLEFEEVNWSDTLDFKLKLKNSPEEKVKIKKAIDDHQREYQKRFKKANKAITFVAYNFPGLWD